jgi:hypothetical protein
VALAHLSDQKNQNFPVLLQFQNQTSHRGSKKKKKKKMKEVGKAAKASGGMQGMRRTESEKEKTKMRERQRRAITTNIFHGLRKHGGYRLSPRADINEVLRELAKEAGWVVLPDGTTYRSFSSPHVTLTSFFLFFGLPFLANQSKFYIFIFFLVYRVGVAVRFVGRGERATTAQRRAARFWWMVAAEEEEQSTAQPQRRH